MPKPSFKKNSNDSIELKQEDKRVHAFPNKEPNIARLEFELVYLEAAVQHFSHFATGTPPASWSRTYH